LPRGHANVVSQCSASGPIKTLTWLPNKDFDVGKGLLRLQAVALRRMVGQCNCKTADQTTKTKEAKNAMYSL
jgi:hypothetical protein